MVARPQPPCRPTKVSRLARPEPDELPASPDTFCSIWNTALRPPPRLSVPRMPKRDEFELTRLTVLLEIWLAGIALAACEHTKPFGLGVPPKEPPL